MISRTVVPLTVRLSRSSTRSRRSAGIQTTAIRSSSSRLCFFRGNPKVELPSIEIDAHHSDTCLVPQPVATLGPPAGQTVCRLIEIVVVVGQGADVDEALHRELLGLGEEAIVRDTGNHYFERHADSLAEICQ